MQNVLLPKTLNGNDTPEAQMKLSHERLALGSAEDESSNVNDEDSDYLLALALNREFRKEEEELSFRSVQVIQT